MLALTDLDVALAAARAGGAVLDEMYGTVLAVEHKTATDGFEGEELGAVRVGVRGRTWLVDPLCGTVNFAAEAPAFCVNVALVEHGVTTTAVVCTRRRTRPTGPTAAGSACSGVTAAHRSGGRRRAGRRDPCGVAAPGGRSPLRVGICSHHPRPDLDLARSVPLRAAPHCPIRVRTS